MPKPQSLYRVASVKSGFSNTLGVATLHLVLHDRYDRLSHSGSRWLARAYTAALRSYLARRPHIDYRHEKNWARKLSYIPYGFRAWAEYMPGGFATYYVYEPHHKKMANGKRLDAVTKRLFRHGIEGSGIRNRAYALSYCVSAWAAERHEPVHWLSIGCGTGQPTFDAAKQLPDHLRSQSKIILVDKDEVVLEFAKSLYTHQAKQLPAVSFNCCDILGQHAFARSTQHEEMDIIEIYGMFEYLDDAASVMLLQQAYTALRVGGLFIFSNMDVERPDYDINQRVIGWPELILRSPEEILHLVTQAGIALGEVRFVRTQDNINNIIEVLKK